MLELICKRLLLAVPTLLLVSMMVFGLQKLLPGDPLIAMAGEERDPAVIAHCVLSLIWMRRSPCSISIG